MRSPASPGCHREDSLTPHSTFPGFNFCQMTEESLENKGGVVAELVAECERSIGDFSAHVGAKMSVPCWERAVSHTLFRNKAR